MKLARSFAIARNDTRIARQNYFTMVTLVFFPLVTMVLGKKLYAQALIEEGMQSPTGAEQAVPGLSVTFALLFLSPVIYALFREKIWGTWDRLRGSPASLSEIVMGKAACVLCLLLFQFAVVFVGGAFITGLDVQGSWMSIGLVGIAFDLFVISLGLTIAVLSRGFLQANTIAYLVILLMSFEAGALVPHSSLPAWAQALAPLTPGDWAMNAYREVISGDADSVTSAVLRLLFLAAVLLVLSLHKMRSDEEKVGL
jgi:ABC-2 type transport system permease protein